jgi:hypothetical protein
LLTSPKIASAGSLFASWLPEIKNTITIEKKLWRLWTQRPHTIKLQTTKIKIEITFSVVNLEQDVPKRKSKVW